MFPSHDRYVSASIRRWWLSRCHICSWRALPVERRALSRAQHRAKRLSFSSAVSQARRSLLRARILASRLYELPYSQKQHSKKRPATCSTVLPILDCSNRTTARTTHYHCGKTYTHVVSFCEILSVALIWKSGDDLRYGVVSEDYTRKKNSLN